MSLFSFNPKCFSLSPGGQRVIRLVKLVDALTESITTKHFKPIYFNTLIFI